MPTVAEALTPAAAPARPSVLPSLLPFLGILGLAALLPLSGNEYWAMIGTRAAIYWVLVSGLNLVVGYAGQLAIGWVALLALGAYTASVLAAGNLGGAPWPAFLATAAAGLVGAAAGVVVGSPALRLRTFYFAMTTLGFATIVTQVALAWQDVTGGGIGLPGPAFPAPFDTAWGFYYLCLGLAALCTWMAGNAARSRFGRALVAVRDAEVAAEANGISKPRLLVTVFVFAGATAGVAGSLFAGLQTYITPEAFSFDLSLLFFISILIGGRGSILGPLLGTVILTLLPEIAAPLAAWSTALYAALLLLIVLAIPGGIAALLDFRNRRPLESNRAIATRPALLGALLPEERRRGEGLALRGIVLAFGGVRAIDGLDIDVHPGEVHGLIGPNGSGKTTTLNVISGYYRPQQGTLALGGAPLPAGAPTLRAAHGIARTFQTPRVVGEESVLDNVMLGGTVEGRAGFAEALLALPRQRREERAMRERALAALRVVGLESLAEARADRLQHSELRFVEIARALALRPAFLLLDEPAAGLSTEEIRRLGALIRAIARQGTAVLLVEHHADLIFDICDRVTVLNLGRVLAAGTPAEIRSHKEVVSAYLGG
ncbi:branched-chain amino acid ABC transporter ATP-binding protein/permease [Roseomonas sp. NAR14]|uniref:Branched-chain amino acid ABC transporter ATP-binding protein/permease n=1 Tax=Roseomonas acroporae TaxID=2937791 RepID=A0A9X2BT23_9PROT|nr:branched-chain amino acid ABC transporter ATP-binding protein/permease [Roseomonas acroporae]MCK8784183.1 branched-chain amino acid ABC transporter ATP-binding protein/permease [Roseomonas acroporae]